MNIECGYWTREDILSHDECEQLLTDLSQPKTARSRAGARHLMSHPAVARIANDERLIRIAREKLGVKAVAYRATLFEKSGESNWLVVWHQDTALPLVERFDSAEWGPWSTKAGIHYAHAPTWALQRILALRLHLDDSTAENGPLRVIPGSHQLGVLPDEQVFEIAREQPHIECILPRGGVLAMRPLLIHSSQKAASPASRRVLHIEYAAELDLAPGIRLAVA
jgi:ectoine hydroxylase-related dioxygenase (phytanoyl-CoA dioxygenase family)